ncbi:hypothetical protein [Nocardia heshunensis]
MFTASKPVAFAVLGVGALVAGPAVASAAPIATGSSAEAPQRDREQDEARSVSFTGVVTRKFSFNTIYVRTMGKTIKVSDLLKVSDIEVGDRVSVRGTAVPGSNELSKVHSVTKRL